MILTCTKGTLNWLKTHFVVTVALFAFMISPDFSWGQIIGETDDISASLMKDPQDLSKSRVEKINQLLSQLVRCDAFPDKTKEEGVLAGEMQIYQLAYAQGEIDGSDFSNCPPSKSNRIYVQLFELCNAPSAYAEGFVVGAESGWYTAYDEAYAAANTSRASSCPDGTNWNAATCECMVESTDGPTGCNKTCPGDKPFLTPGCECTDCVFGNLICGNCQGAVTTWYHDKDYDGYISESKQQCNRPDPISEWHRLGNDYGWFVKGIDCDDSDNSFGVSYNKRVLNECGDCGLSSTSTTVWYLDSDNDDYQAGIKVQCSSPGAGWVRKNSKAWYDDFDDCDSEPLEHAELTWYKYNDADDYWGESRLSCGNPGKGTAHASKWKISSLSGEDCDDDDPDAHLSTDIWYFYGDADNYWGVSTMSCANPGRNNGTEEKWRKDTGDGEDCDDSDEEIHGPRVWYFDQDGDRGFTSKKVSCDNPGLGTLNEDSWTTGHGHWGDCAPLDPTKYRTYDEICIGDLFRSAYIDLDGDGYHSVRRADQVFLSDSLNFNHAHLNPLEVDLVEPIILKNWGPYYPSNFPVHLMRGGFKNFIVNQQGSSFEVIFKKSKINPNREEFRWFERYVFPSELISYETLGLDCDDLNPSIFADGTWVKDHDHDGFHEQTAKRHEG